MKISLNWLKDYIDLPKDVTADKLAHDLTMSTVEVEGVVDQAQQFSQMVVGQVKEIKPHPNADKLRLAMTDIGGEAKQIVCGGENLKEGMLVAVALPGAKVKWHGEGDLVTLEKAKIRGEESFGMICASEEIGLGEVYPNNGGEIMDISFCQKKPGTSLAKALGFDDVVIEIDNKSLTNRPDLWSHHGIARELAAIYNVALNEPYQAEISLKKPSPQLNIKINSDKCRAYIGALVENIKIEPSPEWMQARLISVGLRPINNIVDLTNYVMLDVGEPMHAFDFKSLAGGIIVRLAKPGEKLKTLEGEERKLSSDDLIIADHNGPVALAGIKGGADSGVEQQTNKIVIEAANFDPLSIRKTSASLNLRTDASMRHEKSLDQERPFIGLARFVYLLKQICPQAEIKQTVAVGKLKTPSVTIRVDISFINKRLGKDLTKKEIIGILERLGFLVKSQGDKLTVKVPHWRATGDVSIPEDIVEEVGRIYGYDNLGMRPIKYEMEKAVFQPKLIWQSKIKAYLSQTAGLNEVYNYPWTDDRLLDILGFSKESLIKISNPPAVNLSRLQNSLLPNLLEKVEYNSRFTSDIKLFEVARVFLPGKGKKLPGQVDFLPKQPKSLAWVIAGEGPEVYFKAKGVLEGLFNYLKFDNWTYGSVSDLRFLSSDKQSILADNFPVGYLGSLKKSLLGKFDLKNKKLRIAMAELNLDELLDRLSPNINYQPLPQFPSVIRDLAFELNKDIVWRDLYEMVSNLDKIIKKVEFLSLYDLGDKNSLALRVEYAAEDRTLTSDEVSVVEKRIIKLVADKLNGKLRG